MNALRNMTVVGIHPVEPSDEFVDETVRIRRGYSLSDADFELAKKEDRDDFKSLFLIEICIDPPDAQFDWSEITQPITDQSQSNWQVPYDEQPIDAKNGRWAFFFHFLDLRRPLSTPVGDIPLPPVTARPTYLSEFHYDSP